jgi:hypothetical protein
MKPMISTGPHSVRATPQFVELCREYAQHYIRCAQEKIEAYRTEITRAKGMRALTGDHEEVVAMRREIARAQVVYEGLDLLRGQLERLYTFHYEQMAQVHQQARIELGLARVEDSPHLYIAVKLTMAMLKAENPKFSEEKFINYINN